MSRWFRSFLVLAVLGSFTVASKADVLELADGTKHDGKILKEDAGVVTLKTLSGVEKIAADKIKSRTPGESDFEKYDKLQTAAATDPITAAALWNLYEFQKAHLAELPPETAKENQRLLQRILKKEPQHVGAHNERGEVEFNGEWVKATDLPRLQAEAEREKRRLEWQTRLAVPVKMVETDHFTLVDNTDDKDLPGRAQVLEKAWDELTKALGLERLWKDRAVIVTIKAYEPFCKALDGFAAEANINATIVAAAKDRGTGGLWRHRPYAFQVRWPSSGTESMWSAIVHNCAHMTVWTIWATGGKPWQTENPPAWIDEGMGAWTEITVMGQQVSSCLGESAKPKTAAPGGTTDKNPKKKKDPKKGGDLLKEAANQFKERCKEAITDDSFPPMRQFLKYKIGDLGPPEEGGCLGLVTWLMKQDPEKFKTLVKSLHIGGKKTDDEYWREAYGFEIIDDMEKKWRGWAVGEW